MQLLVCIKQVPVVAAMQFDPETRTLKREGVPTEVSAFDVRALLKAVELKRTHGGDVVVLTMGPPQARTALEYCLALGADRAVHLCDRAFAGADTLATAQSLAAAIKRLQFDLVLCGRNSTDAETAQVGPELAELLDLPQITGARSLSLDPTERRITAERETDAGFETVTAALPVLVTAAEDLAPERFPSKTDYAAAQAKPIEEIDAAALSDQPDLFGAAGSPTQVTGWQALEEKRQGRMLEAPSIEAAVDELVSDLLGHGLFGTWSVGEPLTRRRQLPPVPRVGAKDVLVVAEVLRGSLRQVTLELLCKAAELAAQLGGSVWTLLAGDGVRSHVDTLAAHGGRRVFLADSPGWRAPGTEAYAAMLTRVIEAYQPGIVLVPSTVFGRDVAPRVAARLRLGLTGDCIDLSLDAEGHLLQHKPAFGGSIVAPIVSRTRPEMSTLRPGMLPVGTGTGPGRAEVVPLDDAPTASRVRIVSQTAAGEAAADLDHAAVVVGVGMGVGGPENLPLLRELADVVGGALCATRDVTDKGWLPKQYQVGLTGRAIAPKLYIAVGIRGAFEHVVGVRRAGIVVAINTKPRAPIFKAADYGIVADYAACVPLLTARLRQAKAQRS